MENVSLGESEKQYSNESWGTVGKHGENMAKIWGKIGKYEGNMVYECLNAFKMMALPSPCLATGGQQV